jgi:hypothetical protein
MTVRVIHSEDREYPWTVAWMEGEALVNQGFTTWQGAVKCALILAYNMQQAAAS